MLNEILPPTSEIFRGLMQYDRPIALIGMMGAGKTTVARQLSALLGISYYDMDRQIEKEIACSIPEYFQQQGEPAFREVEARVITSYLDRGCNILALGGGAFIQDSLRDQLLKRALCVYLDVPLETLWQRVKMRKSRRPMIGQKDPKKGFSELYVKRLPIYRKAPLHITLSDECSGITANRVKQLVWEQVNKVH